jgi:hypothetical protein
VQLAARDATDAAIAKLGTPIVRVEELGLADIFLRHAEARARRTITTAPAFSTLAC